MSRRAGVLGSPIGHSLSPALHRAAYTALGLDWSYDAYDVDEARLPAFLAGLDPTWRGLSLTMPLKRAVLPLLDEVSPLAAAVQAANTVLLDDGGGGRRRGENTDAPGMVAALREAGVTAVRRPAVLGAGATAASALAALAELGATTVRAHVRDPARAGQLHASAARLGVQVELAGWELPAEADVVVATTPANSTDALAELVPGSVPGLLFDVVYAPWPTRLASAWAGSGGAVVGGLALLVHQAAGQVELMTGVPEAPVAAMRAAGEAALRRPTPAS